MFTNYLKLIDFFPKESLNNIHIHTSSIFILIKSIPFYFITTLLSTQIKKSRKKRILRLLLLKLSSIFATLFFIKTLSIHINQI